MFPRWEYKGMKREDAICKTVKLMREAKHVMAGMWDAEATRWTAVRKSVYQGASEN
jgi:hypothetical protein